MLPGVERERRGERSLVVVGGGGGELNKRVEGNEPPSGLKGARCKHGGGGRRTEEPSERRKGSNKEEKKGRSRVRSWWKENVVRGS